MTRYYCHKCREMMHRDAVILSPATGTPTGKYCGHPVEVLEEYVDTNRDLYRRRYSE